MACVGLGVGLVLWLVCGLHVAWYWIRIRLVGLALVLVLDLYSGLWGWRWAKYWTRIQACDGLV